MIKNQENIVGNHYYINKGQKLVVMYLELIFTGIKDESWKVAELRLSLQGLKQVGKILYAGIETSKKDCLCHYCESWDIKIAEEKSFIKRLKQVGNAVYRDWGQWERLLMQRYKDFVRIA